MRANLLFTLGACNKDQNSGNGPAPAQTKKAQKVAGTKTIAASRKAGLSVTAYSPIARGKVKRDAVLSRIGKAHGKTAAQICLRYLVQQDIVVIPKTSRSERLKENATIFDFKLTVAEMKDIAALASPHGNILS